MCPVCKRKVFTGDERPSDLETDSEDENSPLINTDGGTQGGTFANQRVSVVPGCHGVMRTEVEGLVRVRLLPKNMPVLSTVGCHFVSCSHHLGNEVILNHHWLGCTALIASIGMIQFLSKLQLYWMLNLFFISVHILRQAEL